MLVGLTARFVLVGDTANATLQLCLVCLILLALGACAQRARRSGPEALGWKLLACSLLINVLIQITRIPIFLNLHPPKALEPISIALQILSSLLPAGTLLSWHLAPKARLDRIRHGLDGLLFALAVFFILWGLALGPVFASDRFPITDRFIWLGAFLVYDLLLGLSVFYGITEPARFRGPLGWLASAFLLASLHNFKWLMDVLLGRPVFHFPAGGFVFLIPLAYLGAALSTRPVAASHDSDQQAPVVHLLPYLPVLGATVLGIWLLVTRSGSGHQLVLVWMALGLVVLLLTRQYLALKDFATLSQHLEARVAERTETLEKAQGILLRTERMNTMATLGAGLAHDMNNLLNAIQARAELVIMDLDDGKLPERTDMMRVQEATQHAATLSRRLMSLGRQTDEPPQIMDLGEELQAISPLLRVLLPKSQNLTVEAQPSSMPFLGTRGMVEQILVNLVSNARDAMPTGGTITIRARAARPEEGPAGPLLEIQDMGSGIPEHLHAQLFQPFFTTKSEGTGTGLGLVCVKTMLEEAGGSIRFSPAPGQGTLFQIRLPRVP